MEPKFIPHFPGTANEGYDTAEEVAKQGMDSIKQVVGGLQNSLNEVANGFVGGINAAHKEAVDTVQDAILSKWSIIVNMCPPDYILLGLCWECILI